MASGNLLLVIEYQGFETTFFFFLQIGVESSLPL